MLVVPEIIDQEISNAPLPINYMFLDQLLRRLVGVSTDPLWFSEGFVPLGLT